MNLVKLLDKNNVREYLNSIPYINRGGCGIAALAMYRWLEKQNVDTTKIKIHILEMHFETTIDNNKKYLETNEGYPEPPSHIGLKIGNKTIDTEDTVDMHRYQYHMVTDQIQLLITMINMVRKWNPMFDRERIPEIADRLGIDLSDININ